MVEQILIKLFQIGADWLLLTFTTVQAITEIKSYKFEMKKIESHDEIMHLEGFLWWFFFPFRIYQEKKELRKTENKSLSNKDHERLQKSLAFLSCAEAWLFIVLGSCFYLISTTIDIFSSIIIVPKLYLFIVPFLFVLSGLIVAHLFIKSF